MFKKLCTIAIIASFILPCTTFAQETLMESILTVEGTVNTDLEPDTLRVKFYVENTGTNLADIKAKNDKTVNTAVNAIKAKLNSDESVKTIAFRVNNIYSYKDKVRIFQKYEVVNGFEVKLKDLSKTSEIIKIAMDNGVKRIDNLNFYIENTEKQCNELIKQATSIAKNRAAVVASAAGATLTKPKSINPYCSLNSNYINRRVFANAMMKSSADGAMAEAQESVDAIEPGTISARASVNMTYYLK